MALNETLTLNITEAQRQISVLESQLDQLSRPITVPVNVQGGGELDSIRRDLDSSEGAVAELNRELGETDDQLRTVAGDAKRAGDDIERTGRRGATAFDGLGRSLLGFTAALGGIALVRGAFDFAGDAITAASSLEQSVGALDAVFGELGTTVAEFGETADQSVGLAASQFNQLAAVLGSQLQTFGFNVQDAATETQNLITLASDLAATFGGPVSQAVEAISSLLRGEVNPIERYGVAMNEAAIQSRALEDGLAATASELTFQDKTMARLAILYEQTANAQGQFARESDTTAGMLERLNAQFENARAAVGEALVPAFQALLDIAPGVIDAIERGLVPALAGLATAAEDVDGEGVVAFVSGLPQAAITATSQFESATSAAGDFFTALEALFGLRFGEFAAEFSSFTQNVEDFQGTGIANQSIQTFIDTIATGTPAIKTLDAVLFDLGKRVSGLNPDQFEELAEQLVAMAVAGGADIGQLRDLAETIRVFGEAAGFSAPGVEILIDTLMGPWAQAMAEASSGDIIFGNLAAAITETGDAALEAAPAIIAEATAFDRLAESISFDFDDVTDEFDLLIEKTDEAGEKVPATVEEMLTNLREQVNNQARLEAATTVLELLGLDDLAAELRSLGPDAVQAAEDFVADIESAFEAEDLLDDGGELGDQGLRGLKEALANGTITPELAELAEQFTSAEIQNLIYLAGLTSGETYIDGVDAALIAAALTLDIPVNFLLDNIDLGGGPFLPSDPPLPPGVGTTGGAKNNLLSIEQNFNGFVPSSTDAAKAAQALAIVAGG